jgi:hypothetical protein
MRESFAFISIILLRRREKLYGATSPFRGRTLHAGVHGVHPIRFFLPSPLQLFMLIEPLKISDVLAGREGGSFLLNLLRNSLMLRLTLMAGTDDDIVRCAGCSAIGELEGSVAHGSRHRASHVEHGGNGLEMRLIRKMGAGGNGMKG